MHIVRHVNVIKDLKGVRPLTLVGERSHRGQILERKGQGRSLEGFSFVCSVLVYFIGKHRKASVPMVIKHRKYRGVLRTPMFPMMTEMLLQEPHRIVVDADEPAGL